MSALTTVAADPVARLVVEGGRIDGAALDVRGAALLIGSGTQCHFRTTGAAAELHCAVVARAGRFFVRNFALPEGTLLAGRRVLGELELRDQDCLQIGLLGLRVCIGQGDAALPAPPQTRTPLQAAPARQEETVDLGALPTPPPGDGPGETQARPRRPRVTQIIAKPPPNTGAPRKTRPTLALPRADVAAAPTASAPEASAPQRPRRPRSTLLMSKEARAAAAEAVPPPPSRPPQVDEASSAGYLLANDGAPAPPQLDPAPEAPAATTPGNLPAYSVASDAQGRPVLRIVVGRKDRAQPMLRKWEMEGARVATQAPLPRRYPSAVPAKLRALGVASLVALALIGGFYLGRPGQLRARSPNPFVITVDHWNRLSEDDKLDPLFRDALEKPVTTDHPPPPAPPLPGSTDPNI